MVWPEDIFSIILATLLGAAIGLERELSGKAAGLRTNVLICLGAAVFTIISREMVAQTDGSVARRCPDMTKTIKATGYEPEYDLKSGLTDMFQKYEKAECVY